MIAAVLKRIIRVAIAVPKMFEASLAPRDQPKNKPELMKNKAQPTSNYTSCYVFNACYTAPVVTGRMKTFTPMGYQYVLAVDQLDTMRSNFYDIHHSNLITNDSLDVWRT